jgi:hypothetical protein
MWEAMTYVWILPEEVLISDRLWKKKKNNLLLQVYTL